LHTGILKSTWSVHTREVGRSLHNVCVLHKKNIARTTVNLLKLQPHKITVVHSAATWPTNFSNWYFQSFSGGIYDPNLICIFQMKLAFNSHMNELNNQITGTADFVCHVVILCDNYLFIL
jgi:hypothetical protein